MQNTGSQPQELWVGKDHLTIEGDQLIIDAANEMPDWVVREFRRNPIFVGDHKFFLRQRIKGQKPFAMRYVLERWPEDASFDAAPLGFVYDENFVRERDADQGSNQRTEALGKLLIALYPLLGFLWSGTKKKLIPCGFIPRSITGISIFAGVCLLILQGTFIRMQLGLFTLLFGKIERIEVGLLTLDYALLGVMLIDIVLRFDQHLKHVEHPWGFGEWITAPFRKKPVVEEA